MLCMYLTTYDLFWKYLRLKWNNWKYDFFLNRKSPPKNPIGGKKEEKEEKK
jgi:hypothetical protein